MKNIMPPINTPDNAFHDGNPATGEQGTIVPGLWLNNSQDATRNIQQELISVLTGAGIEIDESKNNQLLDSILKLIIDKEPDLPIASLVLKGIVQLSSSVASSSESLAATPKAVKLAYDAALKSANHLSEIAVAGSVAQSETQANIGLTGGLSAGAIGRLIAKRSITSTGVIPKATGAKWAIIRAWSAGGGGGGAGRTVTAGNASQGWAGQSGSFIE
ncbi:tail fiber protein, partial [Yersinia enterocolitica]|nr:tail fiber protein [Yersinia enterocolitica]